MLNDVLLTLNNCLYDRPKLAFDLKDRFDSVAKIHESFESILDEMGVSSQSKSYYSTRLKKFDINRFKSDLSRLDISCVYWGDDIYPNLLTEIYDPPIVLYVKGDASLLTRSMLAVVGPRKMTSYGERACQHLVKELVPYFIIVSGLALGLDAIAHQSALDGAGKTIAVLPTGLHTVYPPRHRYLFDRIGQDGLLITEFPLGVQSLPHYFPQRNRIVSGISTGVLVCEAAESSGSLLTARIATEQNRDVFVVPGSIFSEQSRGANQLIKDGAILVNHVDDILAEQGLFQDRALERLQLTSKSTHLIDALDGGERAVYDALQSDMSIDELVAATSLDVHEVLQSLTLLEVNDLVEALPGNRYRREL